MINDMERVLKEEEGEELSVHIDPVHTTTRVYFATAWQGRRGGATTEKSCKTRSDQTVPASTYLMR